MQYDATYDTAMEKLNIDLDADLIEGIRQLAVTHYGDSGDASISQVVEAALEMHLMWAELVKEGGMQVEEPITNWEFETSLTNEQAQAELRKSLFKRRE